MDIRRICQAALLKNGQHEILEADFYENPTTKSAELCATFYDQARRAVLRMQPWTCARKRVVLTAARWEPGKAVSLGDNILVNRAGLCENYTCTYPGTTGTIEPDWPEERDPVPDDTAEWRFKRAMNKLPPTENHTPYSTAYPVPANFIRLVAVKDSSGRDIDASFEDGILYCDDGAPILTYIYDNNNPVTWDSLLVEAITLQLASELAYPLAGSHENTLAFAQAGQGMIREALRLARRENRQGPGPADPWMGGLFPERKK